MQRLTLLAKILPVLALICFAGHPLTVRAQEKALEVQENASAYQIEFLTGIFLPFTKSCSVKVTLPSGEEIMAEVPKDNAVVVLPKSKVAATDEIRIRGSRHEYNGKKVLPCTMLPAKITIAEVVTGRAPTKTPEPEPATAAPAPAPAQATTRLDATAAAAQAPPEPKGLTLKEMQAIHDEVQSQHRMVHSTELVELIEENFKAGKSWHQLLIQAALTGEIPGKEASKPKPKPKLYQISDSSRKKYFDAMLKLPSAPWALAAAANGCHSYRTNRTEWNSKWSAVRACNKFCGTDDCKVLYVNKNLQPLDEADPEESAAAAPKVVKPTLAQTKVITLFTDDGYEENYWPRATLIFAGSGKVIAAHRFYDLELKKWKADYAVYANMRATDPVFESITVVGSGPTVFLLPGGSHMSFASEDTAYVVALDDGRQKKYRIKDKDWPLAGQFQPVFWRTPLGYDAFYEDRSSASGLFATGAYLGRFRDNGVSGLPLAGLCPDGFRVVVTSVVGEKLDAFCAPVDLIDKRVRRLEKSIPKLSGDSFRAFDLFYRAQALFAAGFVPPAIKAADEAVALLGPEIDSDRLFDWLTMYSAVDRFPYAAGKLSLEAASRAARQESKLLTLTQLAAYNFYVRNALVANQSALAMIAAEEALKKETDAKLCATLAASGNPSAKACESYRKVLEVRYLLSRLALEEISLDAFLNEMASKQALIGTLREQLKYKEFAALWEPLRNQSEKLAFLYRLEGSSDDVSAADVAKEMVHPITPRNSPYVDLRGELVPAVSAPDIALDQGSAPGLQPTAGSSVNESQNAPSDSKDEPQSFGGATLM
ncbi:MAG: hypothetical protein VW771_06655, partial [Gammaproteobacteria bacterium]